MKKFKKFLKNVLSTMFNQLKFLKKMKKVISLLVIVVLFSLSACMKFELPKEKTTTEKGSNKDTNGKTDKTEDQPAKPDPEEEQYGTGVLLTPQEDYVKIPLASLPVRGEKHLPSSFKLPFPDWAPQQGQIGSCMAHSLTSLIMYSVNFKLRKIDYQNTDFYPSPSFIYNIGKAPGDCDAGMYVKDGLELVVKTGVPPLKIMPYRYECSIKPSADAYRWASKTKMKRFARLPLDATKIKEAIHNDYPVLCVVDIGRNFRKVFNKGQGAIWSPQGEKLTQAYHALLLIGYKSGSPGYFVAYNSWGNNKGADGSGTLRISEEMLEAAFIKECYVIQPFDTYQPLTDEDEDQEDDTPKPEPQKIEVSKPELNFSVTTIGQRVKQTLEVELVSGDDTQLSLKLSDPSNFEVKDMKEVNLYKGAKRSIEIFYTPKTPASHTASLTLTTPEGFNYKVRIYGEATKEPERDLISLNTNYLDFGSIQIDQTSTKELTITNEGNVEATLSLSIEGEGVYSLPNRQIILPSGARKTIHIRFYPNRAGSYQGRLLLRGTHGFEQIVLLKGIANEKENQEDHRDNDRGDNHHDDRDQRDNDRDQQRGTTKYIVKEERPKVNLEADYCGRGSMGITYAGVIGIDEQGSVVRDLGSQLEVKIKVIKIDDNKIFTYNGEIFHKNGKNFCTKIFDSNTYNGGSSAIYTKTFKVNKGDEDNTVWILCVSNNGYRFYTKVQIIKQR